jgi:hypothetical protein
MLTPKVTEQKRGSAHGQANGGKAAASSGGARSGR